MWTTRSGNYDVIGWTCWADQTNHTIVYKLRDTESFVKLNVEFRGILENGNGWWPIVIRINTRPLGLNDSNWLPAPL